MGIAFQIVSVILIIGAVLLFCKRTSRNTIFTKGQKALSVFQIVLCGGFFALCLSDVLDINANFSAVRFFLNIFYALVFLSLTAFGLSGLHQKQQKHILPHYHTLAAAVVLDLTYGKLLEVEKRSRERSCSSCLLEHLIEVVYLACSAAGDNWY